jgi:hypothetical protein
MISNTSIISSKAACSQEEQAGNEELTHEVSHSKYIWQCRHEAQVKAESYIERTYPYILASDKLPYY